MKLHYKIDIIANLKFPLYILNKIHEFMILTRYFKRFCDFEIKFTKIET